MPVASLPQPYPSREEPLVLGLRPGCGSGGAEGTKRVPTWSGPSPGRHSMRRRSAVLLSPLRLAGILLGTNHPVGEGGGTGCPSGGSTCSSRCSDWWACSSCCGPFRPSGEALYWRNPSRRPHATRKGSVGFEIPNCAGMTPFPASWSCSARRNARCSPAGRKHRRAQATVKLHLPVSTLLLQRAPRTSARARAAGTNGLGPRG